MTDLEISKALALAIGWNKNALYVNHCAGALQLDISNASEKYPMWAIFDYRDWNVIGPIAERYDCFPYLASNSGWTSMGAGMKYRSTPQKAIAMAVINGSNK